MALTNETADSENHNCTQPNLTCLLRALFQGHYVPAVAHRIWSANKRGKGPPIAFKGLAIGNGLTDPALQYGAYADFAYDHGLIGKTMHSFVQAVYPICKLGANVCATYK